MLHFPTCVRAVTVTFGFPSYPSCLCYSEVCFSIALLSSLRWKFRLFLCSYIDSERQRLFILSWVPQVHRNLAYISVPLPVWTPTCAHDPFLLMKRISVVEPCPFPITSGGWIPRGFISQTGSADKTKGLWEGACTYPGHIRNSQAIFLGFSILRETSAL